MSDTFSNDIPPREVSHRKEHSLPPWDSHEADAKRPRWQSLTGRLVYPDVWWRLDLVGLRDPDLAEIEASLAHP